MQDLIGGRLDYMAEQISTAFPQIEGKTVKAIVTLGPDRLSVLPDLPSAKESGLGDFDCSAWAALVGPLKTPTRSCASSTRPPATSSIRRT